MPHSDQEIKRALGFAQSDDDSNCSRAYAHNTNPIQERYSMRNNSPETVSIAGTAKHQTANAILWVCSDEVPIDLQAEPNAHTVGIWIPFSHVTEIHPDRLVITRWMATQKGIE